MSYLIICDYCGDEIDRDASQLVTINAEGDKGDKKRHRWKKGYVGHYHGDPCWDRVFRAIQKFHEGGGNLDAIPVATPEQLAEVPAPDHENECPLDNEPLWEESKRPDGGAHIWPREEMMCLGLTSGALSPRDFHAHGVQTLGDLRRAVKDGSLLQVRRVGPKVLASIGDAVERFVAANLGQEGGDA